MSKRDFPKTHIAYQFAIEYCTIQKMELYQYEHFDIKAGKPSRFNSKGDYEQALNSFHRMADEFREIMKGEINYLKKEIIRLVKKYSEDERLIQFRLSAYEIINNFNDGLPFKLLNADNLLDTYFKDGFIVAHDFVETAKHLLSEYAPIEILEKIEKEDKGNIINNIETPRQDSNKNKINTKFTVGQMAYLFRLLFDNDYMKTEEISDLGEFIGTHFQNKRTNEIDIRNANNLLSTPEKKDADKVAEILKILMIKAVNFEIKPLKKRADKQ